MDGQIPPVKIKKEINLYHTLFLFSFSFLVKNTILFSIILFYLFHKFICKYDFGINLD